MVVSQSKNAAEAGVAVLDAGGNAIDAAVATALALAAVEPWNSGLGGIGHAVVHRAGQARAEVVDFGPTAPAALDATRFKLTGRVAADLFGWPEVEGDANIHGPLSFVIPSAVAGYAEMHSRWGRLPLAEIATPAVALAKRGLPQDWYTTLKIANSAAILRKYPESARIYLRDGLPPVPPYQGALSYFRLGRLSETLERLAQAGWRDFYEGEIACQHRCRCARHGRRAVGGRFAQLQGARSAGRRSAVALAHAANNRPAHGGADGGGCVAANGRRARRSGTRRRVVRGARSRTEGGIRAAARLARRCRTAGSGELHQPHLRM